MQRILSLQRFSERTLEHGGALTPPKSVTSSYSYCCKEH